MSLTRGRELPIGARAGLIDPKHVRAMGSARWLYDWILWRVTSEQDGVGRVLGGSPVRCEEIAADLGVGLRTIYRWMDRLRGPYIRTRHVVVHGHHGLAIEVLKSKKFRPVRQAGTSRISTISTASTGNPAGCGSRNPAGFGRDNPAKSGGFHKEYRKPFTESPGKWNSDFQEDLPQRVSPPKADPPSPPIRENQRAKQIPHSDGTGIRSDQVAQVSGACAEASADVWNTRTDSGAGDGKGDGGAGRGIGERELLESLRCQLGVSFGQVLGGKTLPRETDPARRQMLERQKCELLRRVVGPGRPP